MEIKIKKIIKFKDFLGNIIEVELDNIAWIGFCKSQEKFYVEIDLPANGIDDEHWISKNTFQELRELLEKEVIEDDK